jgi:hypothetical protein
VGFSKIARHFKCIFNRIEAFLKWCEAFQKIRDLFKTFKEKLRLATVMWGILNDFEAFIKIMRLYEDISREMEAFSKIKRPFEDIFNRIEAFLKLF